MAIDIAGGVTDLGNVKAIVSDPTSNYVYAVTGSPAPAFKTLRLFTPIFSLATNNFVLAIFLITIIALSGCKKDFQHSAVQDEISSSNARSAVAEEQQSANAIVPNEILVKFKAGTSERALLLLISS